MRSRSSSCMELSDGFQGRAWTWVQGQPETSPESLTLYLGTESTLVLGGYGKVAMYGRNRPSRHRRLGGSIFVVQPPLPVDCWSPLATGN
jgi:hypothetical protein